VFRHLFEPTVLVTLKMLDLHMLPVLRPLRILHFSGRMSLLRPLLLGLSGLLVHRSQKLCGVYRLWILIAVNLRPTLDRDLYRHIMGFFSFLLNHLGGLELNLGQSGTVLLLVVLDDDTGEHAFRGA